MKVKFMKDSGFLMFDNVLSVDVEFDQGRGDPASEDVLVYPPIINNCVGSNRHAVTLRQKSRYAHAIVISIPTEHDVFLLNDNGDTIETIYPAVAQNIAVKGP